MGWKEKIFASRYRIVCAILQLLVAVSLQAQPANRTLSGIVYEGIDMFRWGASPSN